MELDGTGMLNDTERIRVGIQTHKIVLPAI
jgi:hypothetical protein